MSINIRMPLNALHTILHFTDTATMLRMREVSKEVDAMVESYVTENGVSSVTVYPAGRTDFSSCLSMIAKLHPLHVTFHSMGCGQLTMESIQFLQKIADSIGSISIVHENRANTAFIPHPLFVNIIKSLMMRKCQRLEVKDYCRNIIFGAAEQQELLQFLNRSTHKTLLFECVSRQEAVTLQIGVYSLATDGEKLTIKPIHY